MATTLRLSEAHVRFLRAMGDAYGRTAEEQAERLLDGLMRAMLDGQSHVLDGDGIVFCVARIGEMRPILKREPATTAQQEVIAALDAWEAVTPDVPRVDWTMEVADPGAPAFSNAGNILNFGQTCGRSLHKPQIV